MNSLITIQKTQRNLSSGAPLEFTIPLLGHCSIEGKKRKKEKAHCHISCYLENCLFNYSYYIALKFQIMLSCLLITSGKE